MKANQPMGVNLTAPVVQLQVPFAMMLAVVMLHEKFTVLQAIGSALMLGGSFITQGNAGKRKRKASAPLTAAKPIPTAPSHGELAAPVPKPIFQPARVLRLHLWSGRGDVLWWLAPDGPSGLSTCT